MLQILNVFGMSPGKNDKLLKPRCDRETVQDTNIIQLATANKSEKAANDWMSRSNVKL